MQRCLLYIALEALLESAGVVNALTGSLFHRARHWWPLQLTLCMTSAHFAEMMERDHQDAATVMQQAGAGNRLPLEKTGAANQAVRQHASQQHCPPMQPAPSMSHAHHALVCTPIAQSRPAMQPSSALQGFTPPDRLTQMRPCAALMPQHMQHEQLGSRLAVLPPMDLTRPPMPPQLAAPMPLAPANAKTAGLLAMYHMARAGLAQQGITIPVSRHSQEHYLAAAAAAAAAVAAAAAACYEQH